MDGPDLRIPGVVCMFGHKTIYKVKYLKVPSKGRYLVKKKIPFHELQWMARLDYNVVFSCICDITKINPAHGNSNGWQVGRTLGCLLHVSKWKPGGGVFISLYF